MTTVARSERWREARRVLCVRLDNMGDVLMTTPAMRALRETVPGRRITLLTSPAGAAAAPHVPEVDDVIALDVPWVQTADKASAEAGAALIAVLREQRFDAAVIFTVYSQSSLPAAMACWLAGIPLRLAYSRENPYQLLTDWEPDPEPHAVVRHEVRRQLDLVRTAGCVPSHEKLSFRITEADTAAALAALERAGIDLSRPWIVVHPGATAASRRYPAECYAEAIAALDSPNHQVVLTGTAHEADLVQSIANAAGGHCHALAGAFTLGELAAVIRGAAVLVGNNTGPAHLAAAVGTPVVDIYALTNPQHAPWGVPSRVLYHDVPCRFCYRSICTQKHHACLKLLPPGSVASAARELLGARADSATVRMN